MAEQSTDAVQSGGDRGGDTTLPSTQYPLGLMQSVSTEELARRRTQHIADTLRQAGIKAGSNHPDSEELLVAYDRLAARRAAERTQA